MKKPFPKFGCACDLDPGEALTDCVINEGAPGDCSLAVIRHHPTTGNPLWRRTPTNCPYWIKADGYDPMKPLVIT